MKRQGDGSTKFCSVHTSSEKNDGIKANKSIVVQGESITA